ncbi:hypothetical protein BH23GEM11_BH23GEM11_02090 [soil metagenome]
MSRSLSNSPPAGLRVLGATAVALSLFLPAPAAAQDYYTDVRPVLTANCLACHTESGPAWSMADPEATFERSRLIAAMVLDRIMPPWIAEPGHQAYMDDPTLDPEVLAMIRRWREAGFPRGEPRPDGPVPAAETHGGGAHAHGFRPDLTLDVLPGAVFLPNQENPDDYRCFVVDWPGTDPAFVTGFRARPGNLQVAHHVVVHAVDADLVPRFREFEEDEVGPGYQCFGGALPDRLGQRAVREAYEARHSGGVRELSLGNFWLAHWAPGMDGHVFPSGTGIRMEPGSALVVQMHYYGGAAPGEQDEGSMIDFILAEEVERPAFHFAQTRPEWLVAERNRTMVIAPGTMETYEVSDPLEALLPYIARVTQVPQDRIAGLEVHSVNLHMHAFGHSGRISLIHGTGRRETLLSVPRWDLRWQRDFTFADPKVFPRGDLRGVTLNAECTFRNPTEETVLGGYGSFDEMCFNFAYIAVQVGSGESEEPGGREARGSGEKAGGR